MEHAPYSPIASTSRQPYQPDSPLIPTSDFGEREEGDAASGGEGYWSKRGSAKRSGRAGTKARKYAVHVESDDELAMSPLRPQTSLDHDLEPLSQVLARHRPKRIRSTSPPTQSSRTSPPPLRTSVDTSPPARNRSPPKDKKRRSVPPLESDDSSNTLKEIARPKPTRRVSKTSPSPSTSPAPASPPARSPSPNAEPPVLPPSPPVGRSFRTRTAAQLKPFSTEQFRYTKTLLKNGWAGAVVAGPKAVELSAEEIRRKKLEQAGRKKDDLGGWLVDADGDEETTHVRSGRLAKDTLQSSPTSSDESEDGLSLLEREARRRDKMRRETEAGLGIKGKQKSRASNTSSRRTEPSRIDIDDLSAPNPLFVKKKPRSRTEPRTNRPRAESEPPTSSPGTATRHSHSRSPKAARTKSRLDRTSNASGRLRQQRRSNAARADSEPPASSPVRQDRYVTNPINSRMAKPSKSIHARQGRDGRNALDSDILNLGSSPSASDSDDVRVQSLVSEDDGASEVPEDEDDEEEAEEAEEESANARRSRLRLDAKRSRALGAMLPKSFFKKAKADLKLMERERDLGLSSGSEINSGDEEAETAKRNKAKIRKVTKMLDEPMRLDGDVFTDESGEEPDRTDSEAEQDQQEENDAVSAWMRNFAPKRARGGGQDAEDDIVDRFLKRARRPTKAGNRTSRKGPQKGKEKSKDSSRKKERREGGNGNGRRANKVQTAAPTKSTRRPTKAVHLDTERSIFVYAGLRAELGEDGDDLTVTGLARDLHVSLPPAITRSDQQGPPLTSDTQTSRHEEDSEIWATFGKFTPDFGIKRLPSGVQFASDDSFTRNGHLYSLLHPASASLLSCDVYGLTLDSSASPATIESQLPTLVDAIYDSLSNDASTSSNAASGDICRVLRFLGAFVSTTVASCSSEVKYRFGSALATQLDHLKSRIDSNVALEGAPNAMFGRTRILLSWYAVDLTARLGSLSAVGGDSRRLARLVTDLVSRLVQYGVDRSLASLKKVMNEAASGPLYVSDITIEAWTGLVALATREDAIGDAAFDQNDLWTTVTEQTLARVSIAAKRGGPIAGEILSLTTMLLCAVSQFSPSGISTSHPRLRAHWPVMLHSLESIKVTTLAGLDSNVSSTAISRRDRYLSTLFARCLLFVERWKWTLDVRDELLGRLFDLVAARRLANLATEPVADFPAQLVEPSKFGSTTLELANDTAFSIFLKLVTAAANNLPNVTDAEKRKRSTQLTRLAVRLAPMTTAWTRQSPELTKNDSILVNHYSLLLNLALLHPAQSAQKVEQASKLLSFAEVDEEARKVTVRAIRYWALAFRAFDIPMQPLLEWLAKIVVQLTTEYLDVEKQRRIERTDKSKEDQLWPRALLITMSLRLVQDVLRWKKPDSSMVAFPDPALLLPAWTSKLLQSALALDPMIGREVLKTIDCFLILRSEALQAIAPPPREPSSTQQDSQDDYGMDEFDFADPAFDALLGVEDAAAPDQFALDARATLDADKTLAKFIKSNLAPAFFSLVSRIYGNSVASGPTIADRSSYADDVVESWACCIAILVSHGLDSWSAYLRYGDHSFQRIGDGIGKLETSLLLANRIYQYDPSVYSTCAEEILTIWFTTIVSSKLTSQHVLTENLLNCEALSPLFEDAPFGRTVTTHQVNIDQLELLDKRVDLLRVVFSNAAKIAAFQPTAAAPFAKPSISKTVILRYVRELLSATRTNFTAIRDDSTKRTYSKLVRDVLGVLTSAEGSSGRSFNETSLGEIANLRAMISAWLV
ncbi:hypothetical protein JCM11491_004193 [Sporobolomyces phaffii]